MTAVGSDLGGSRCGPADFVMIMLLEATRLEQKVSIQDILCSVKVLSLLLIVMMMIMKITIVLAHLQSIHFVQCILLA